MVCKFRMISHEEEDFVRDFEVLSGQTFFALHVAIQKDLHFDTSQIASFYLCNDQWEKEKEITLFDIAEEPEEEVLMMDSTKFSDHIKEQKQRLLYVFDVFNERGFFMEVVDIHRTKQYNEYPVCTFSKGCPPQQILMDQVFLGKAAEDFDDLLIELFDDDNGDGFFPDSDFGNSLIDDDTYNEF
ncbi:MAG: hypothetical protein ISS19_09430 [Bacteroidales bacterium]|nr:hypothetical protein [Bacteroidales bacterium]